MYEEASIFFSFSILAFLWQVTIVFENPRNGTNRDLGFLIPVPLDHDGAQPLLHDLAAAGVDRQVRHHARPICEDALGQQLCEGEREEGALARDSRISPQCP